jgi:transposase
MDKTAVTKLLGIAWVSVGTIVERVVAQNLDPDRLCGVRNIGIDESSYRKRHQYLNLVVDDDGKRVIWAGKGRSAETLGGFFELLDPAQPEAIATVTLDRAGGYIKSVKDFLPKAQIIFDRFHVQCLSQHRRRRGPPPASAQAQRLRPGPLP